MPERTQEMDSTFWELMGETEVPKSHRYEKVSTSQFGAAFFIFVCLFACLLCFFETEFLHIALAVLELTL